MSADQTPFRSRDLVPPSALLRIGHAPLVGRERELAVLDAELAAVHASPRVVLLSGEPGIGKSRLLREARARAEASGWRTLGGGAEEEVAAIPYFPWHPIVRALLLERDADEDAARGRDEAAVRALVPGMDEDSAFV